MTDSAPRRIDSLLHLEDQAAWEKVPDTHELAQLHRRFWGSHDKSLKLNAKAPQKSMKTPQWMTKATMKATTKMLQRSATTSVLNVPSSNLGSQLFLGRRFWSEGNIFRCTNVASTISNPATGPPRSSSLPHWSSQDNPESVGSSFCYIAVVEVYWLKGRCYWLLYVLCRRLACKKLIIWYRGKRLSLFVEDGVYLYLGPREYSYTEFKTQVWTLVDSDQGECVPEDLAVPDTKLMIIFVSSPKEQRWKGMMKTTAGAISIMNPWTRQEISEALAHSLLPSLFELTMSFCAALFFLNFRPPNWPN